MAYDENLAERVRAALDAHNLFGLVEKKMFGGVAYMLRGNLACGVHKDGLIVRVGPEGYTTTLERPGARVFDLTGRPMTGWVYVEPASLQSEAALGEWVAMGVDFASSLAAK